MLCKCHKSFRRIMQNLREQRGDPYLTDTLHFGLLTTPFLARANVQDFIWPRMKWECRRGQNTILINAHFLHVILQNHFLWHIEITIFSWKKKKKSFRVKKKLLWGEQNLCCIEINFWHENSLYVLSLVSVAEVFFANCTSSDT